MEPADHSVKPTSITPQSLPLQSLAPFENGLSTGSSLSPNLQASFQQSTILWHSAGFTAIRDIAFIGFCRHDSFSWNNLTENQPTTQTWRMARRRWVQILQIIDPNSLSPNSIQFNTDTCSLARANLWNIVLACTTNKLNDECSPGGVRKKSEFSIKFWSCSAIVQGRADALDVRSRQQMKQSRIHADLTDGAFTSCTNLVIMKMITLLLILDWLSICFLKSERQNPLSYMQNFLCYT